MLMQLAGFAAYAWFCIIIRPILPLNDAIILILHYNQTLNDAIIIIIIYMPLSFLHIICQILKLINTTGQTAFKELLKKYSLCDCHDWCLILNSSQYSVLNIMLTSKNRKTKYVLAKGQFPSSIKHMNTISAAWSK